MTYILAGIAIFAMLAAIILGTQFVLWALKRLTRNGELSYLQGLEAWTGDTLGNAAIFAGASVISVVASVWAVELKSDLTRMLLFAALGLLIVTLFVLNTKAEAARNRKRDQLTVDLAETVKTQPPKSFSFYLSETIARHCDAMRVTPAEAETSSKRLAAVLRSLEELQNGTLPVAGRGLSERYADKRMIKAMERARGPITQEDFNNRAEVVVVGD